MARHAALFIVGVALGAALGTAASALAVAGYSARQVLDLDTQFQNGYASGVSDALGAIVDANSSMEFLRSKLACLGAADKAARVEVLRDWATRQLGRHPDAQAASVIIGEACSQ